MDLVSPDIRRRLGEKIAGEIVFSENPGKTIKKWRTSFNVSQSDLAEAVGVSSSVISDYENGRRKSPGLSMIKRIVEALLEIDEMRGGKTIKAYERILRSDFSMDVIYDIKEYSTPVRLEDFIEAISGELVVGDTKKLINGHTIIDSLKAILRLSSDEFYRLYGWSTERALIFTKVSTGKSPMVALRVTNLKPGVVVLHELKKESLDEIAVRIAEIERIPLILTEMDIEEMINRLRF
ncbi:MAG: putative transcriptional regulator [Archaeoglobi archaeon]|nr:putative transcriptional regulator [Archaeoglobi archaeon]MDK2782309.1 putative transcriptional regulator [Archaeoglobi archaeon]